VLPFNWIVGLSGGVDEVRAFPVEPDPSGVKPPVSADISRPPWIRPSKKSRCAEAGAHDWLMSRNQRQHWEKLSLALLARLTSGRDEL
jgi:hypothetical protein